MLPHLEPHLHGKRKILWDWNGTLLDDLRVCVEAIAEEMRLRGLEPVDEAGYRALFGFPVRESYVRFGFDLDRHPFEEIGRGFLRRFHARLPECRLHPGRRETLEGLRARGIRQSILSAAHEPALHAQVRGQGIEHLFERVYGLGDEHAAGKVERGRELMRDLGVDPRETLLVGDTDHDLEVGRALGVDVVLVADGHQSEERLRARHDRVLAFGA